MGMNELLAQAYKTGMTKEASFEGKPAEQLLLEELEKVAIAENIPLDQFSEEDIMDIISGAMGMAKEATPEAGADELDKVAEAKIQEADFLGRVMCHAFFDEKGEIENATMSKEANVERLSDLFLVKEAEVDVDPEFLEAFEAEALQRANDILESLDDGAIKTSSAELDDEELDQLVTLRAAEILAENGYDVEEMADAVEFIS